MSISSWIKAAIAPRRKAALSLTDPTGWGIEKTFSGEAVTATSALSLSAVWGCTNLIAGTIASLPFGVYKDDGAQKVPVKAHPLYRLLHDSPNYDQTALDFWEFISASLELWGNAYARIVRDGQGRVASLVPISPSTVTARREPSGQIKYTWTDDGKHREALDAEVFHVRGFGGNPLGGMSTLQFGRQAFGTARAVDRTAGSVFSNGLRLSGVLTFTEWLKPEQREIAETRLVEKFAGAENAGRPMVLEGGTKWQQLTINPEDAQMIETRRFSVEEICRFFGVPPHMVGHTEKSTSWGSGLEQQTLAFQKFTLRRRLKRIEQAVEKQLLTPSERARGYTVEFNLEGLLRGDSAGRSSFYQTMTQIGAMTINEVRSKENLPPVEGGDVVRMQMQNVPITEANNAN